MNQEPVAEALDVNILIPVAYAIVKGGFYLVKKVANLLEGGGVKANIVRY